MNDGNRESKVDINDLLDKYLGGDESDESDDAVRRPKKRVSARHMPNDAPESGEESAPTESPENDNVFFAPSGSGASDADETSEASEQADVSEQTDAPEQTEPEPTASDAEGEPTAEDGADGPDAEMFSRYADETDDGTYDYIEDSDAGSDQPENGAPNDAMDDFDMNILLGLGMEEELESTVGADRVTEFVEKQQTKLHKTESVNRERAALDYEYTTKSQTREVALMYANAKRGAYLKLAIGIVLTVALFIFECHSLFGITLGGAFDPLVYPVVYIMVGLQLTVITAAFGWKSIYVGFINFFRGKPTPEAVAGFALAIDIIYSVVISISQKFGDGGPMTFNLPVSMMFIMMYAYELINYKRQIYSFSIISSKKKKYALSYQSMATADLEHEAFSDLMDQNDKAEEIGVLEIEGADFVGDFFLRNKRHPGGRKFIGFAVPAVLIVAAAFFAYKFNGSGLVSSGAQAAASVALTCLPLSVFYMFSHPFYRAVKKAKEDDCTIIGESSVEEYADAAIISFDDKNVFPSTGVTVRGINIFGNHMIDRVLYTAASAFCTVGGPLADVFDLATRDIGHSDNVEVGRCLPGLLEVSVDGSHVMFGSIDAIEAAGVRIPRPIMEHRRDSFGESVSIMYMVENGKFVSRMLIQYLVDSDFEFTLKQLDKNGMFVGIKTFDPNVTEEFLGKQVKLKNYPVRVIRCKSLDDKTQTAAVTHSGIVSKDSPKPLLQTVTLCEKVLHARSVNTMLVIISLFISLVISALSVIFSAIELTPAFITLYQLLWIIPMFILSRMIVS